MVDTLAQFGMDFFPAPDMDGEEAGLLDYVLEDGDIVDVQEDLCVAVDWTSAFDTATPAVSTVSSSPAHSVLDELDDLEAVTQLASTLPGEFSRRASQSQPEASFDFGSANELDMFGLMPPSPEEELSFSQLTTPASTPMPSPCRGVADSARGLAPSKFMPSLFGDDLDDEQEEEPASPTMSLALSLKPVPSHRKRRQVSVQSPTHVIRLTSGLGFDKDDEDDEDVSEDMSADSELDILSVSTPLTPAATPKLKRSSSQADLDSPSNPAKKARRSSAAARAAAILEESMRNGTATGLPLSISETPDSEQKRNIHNVLERKRRNDLKSSFMHLKDAIPEIEDNDRAPKVLILKKASEFIGELKVQDALLTTQKEEAMAKNKMLLKRLETMRAQVAA